MFVFASDHFHRMASGKWLSPSLSQIRQRIKHTHTHTPVPEINISIYSIPKFNCNSIRVQNKLIIPSKARRSNEREKDTMQNWKRSRRGKKTIENKCVVLLLVTLSIVVATVSFWDRNKYRTSGPKIETTKHYEMVKY